MQLLAICSGFGKEALKTKESFEFSSDFCDHDVATCLFRSSTPQIEVCSGFVSCL